MVGVYIYIFYLFVINVIIYSRHGKAIRMSYDHKGTDQRESQRITDKGGFMMGNRVNGNLFFTSIIAACISNEKANKL
jgi:serine/threonine protein phosphatase PrpC